MNEEAVQKVTKVVIRQFPEMDGVQPAIKSQPEDDIFVVTYKGTADLPDGKVMKRIVRVVADGTGEVLRISTSR